MGRLGQFFGCFRFTHRVNYLGAPFPLRLGLFGNSPHHVFIQVNVLDFDVGHFDAPGGGLFVQDRLNVCIQRISLGEHIIEFVLSQHRAQRGLGELTGGFEKILHLDNGAFGINYPEINHRIDLN